MGAIPELLRSGYRGRESGWTCGWGMGMAMGLSQCWGLGGKGGVTPPPPGTCLRGGGSREEGSPPRLPEHTQSTGNRKIIGE